MRKVFLIIVMFGLVLAGIPRDVQADTEVTLAFGWRNSDRELGMIENYIGDNSFPFTIVFREWCKPMYDEIVYHKEWAEFNLIKTHSLFQKRAKFVFGLDFDIYKGFTLGIELNVGFMKRKIKEIRKFKHVWLTVPDSVWNINREEKIIHQEMIIPINIFLSTKYKFEQIKDLTGFLRPYIGIGGGIVTAINWDDQFIGHRISQLPDERIVVRGIGIGIAGLDLWITKKFAIFGEARFEMLKDRSGVAYVTGFRFD